MPKKLLAPKESNGAFKSKPPLVTAKKTKRKLKLKVQSATETAQPDTLRQARLPDAEPPYPITRVYRGINDDGKPNGKIIVVLDERCVVLSTSLLLNGNHSEVIAMIAEFGLRQYESAKGVRELTQQIMPAAVQQMRCVESDGFHVLRVGAETTKFYVWRGVVYPFSAVSTVCHVRAAIATEPVTASCSLDEWHTHIGQHLVANPISLVCLCFALSAALVTWLNLPRFTISLIGLSSIGKSTLQQAIQSAIEPGSKVISASGSLNGLRAALHVYQDRPVLIDEMRQISDSNGLVNLLFDLGNGASRVTSTSDQVAKLSAPMHCSALVSNESTLTELLKGAPLNEGVGARYFEILIHGQEDIFPNHPRDLSSKQFAERLKQDSEKFYGAVWDAWIPLIAKSHEKIQKWLPNLSDIEDQLLEGMNVEDPVTRRLVGALAGAAFAGCVASVLGLVRASRLRILSAFRHVLQDHLARRKTAATPIGEEIVAAVRSVIDRDAARFPALGAVLTHDHSGIYGYRRTSKGKVTYLFLPAAFEELFGRKFGNAAVIRQLRASGFLDSDTRGDQKLVRLNDGTAEVRKRFYAVSGDIRFEKD